jgi:uncharacterized damage-inducible protein DinB
MTPDQALAHLTESRQTLLAAIEGLSQESMARERVDGEWTAKDILGHIASWDEVTVDALSSIVASEPFAVEVITDIDAWNGEQAARKRPDSPSVILDRLAAARGEFLALAAQVLPGQWEETSTWPWGGRDTLTEAVSGLAHHEKEHAGAIQRWREP